MGTPAATVVGVPDRDLRADLAELSDYRPELRWAVMGAALSGILDVQNETRQAVGRLLASQLPVLERLQAMELDLTALKTAADAVGTGIANLQTAAQLNAASNARAIALLDQLKAAELDPNSQSLVDSIANELQGNTADLTAAASALSGQASDLGAKVDADSDAPAAPAAPVDPAPVDTDPAPVDTDPVPDPVATDPAAPVVDPAPVDPATPVVTPVDDSGDAAGVPVPVDTPVDPTQVVDNGPAPIVTPDPISPTNGVDPDLNMQPAGSTITNADGSVSSTVPDPATDPTSGVDPGQQAQPGQQTITNADGSISVVPGA